MNSSFTNSLKIINFYHMSDSDFKLPSSLLEKHSLKYTKSNFNTPKIDFNHYDIIYIEVTNLEKKSFKILNDILKQCSNKEVVIFSSEPENLFLLKFVVHFSLNKIYPINVKDSDFEHLSESIVKKVLLKKDEKHQLDVNKKINTLLPILIFKKNRLIFVNKKAKKFLSLESARDIESKIKDDKKISALLNENENSKIEFFMQDKDGKECKYEISLYAEKEGKDKLLTILPLGEKISKENSLNTISRFQFIETLKDRLAQNSIISKKIYILGISISNYQKLLDIHGNIKLHNFVKNFINKLYQFKNSSENLSQWHPSFFLFLAEGMEFEDAKSDLKSIHHRVVHSKTDKDIYPIITSTLIRIDNIDINKIIEIAENISTRSYKNSYFDNYDFFEVNHFSDNIKDEEQIHHHLKTCIGNRTSIKLLNIYKGLCINTKSKIIKEKDGAYFVYCENLQGYSIQFENKTILQTPSLPKDIEASVKYINIEESYAVLNDFRFLKSSANNRRTTRVQPSIRTPIVVVLKKASFQGNIIDISTQAVSLVANKSFNESIKNESVKLQFKLPDKSKEDGFSMIEADSKIMFMQKINEHKTKIVIKLQLENPYDAYLLKYMYDRQKELIMELKKAVKIHSFKKAT